MNSETFCVNPYLNLSVHPSGVVRPCCMNVKSYVTNKGKSTLNQASILEFWNSQARRDLIEALDNGIKVDDCSRCWQEEESGKDSKRIRDNKTYADLQLDKDMLPVVVDLSMGNLCNLKCRICAPAHSSPWMIEESKIVSPKDNKLYLQQPQFTISKESFEPTNEYVWKDIFELLPNAQKLDFAGGEPFYIDKHWDIIQTCVDNGYSKNQHVHYNTNGTIFPDKYIHLFEDFKFVDIQISSDGVGKKFEYMRHPANWEEVEYNIDKFIETKNNSKTEWLLSACISISAFNVYDFFETFEHYASKGIGVYVNMVHDHRSAKVLPLELRKIVVDKLKKLQSKYLQQQWERDSNMVCKYLENMPYEQHSWTNFCDQLILRDKLRNESYPEVFSEFYSYMRDYVER